ncbi:helicase-associated domain-containing protein [Holophaga foetida]|uniref:helicase-associated domain-containing protein n=1 Tax=Holophaga foetida TaxID=35839 RepID=UPI00024750CB|nr:helicase-associated domain-containing protein [Holophaga foetida]
MALSHYQLLSHCTDDQLRRICERRKLPVPQYCGDGDDGRMRLLKTMVFHLEENRHLTNALADLDGACLKALKLFLGDGMEPAGRVLQELADLGLLLPRPGGWGVAERVADALADFDDAAFSFQAEVEVRLDAPKPYSFALSLSSILLRCLGGIRVLKGGLPAKKELGQILRGNALISEEKDATLLFALLHRLGLLWSREGRVDTLLPAVMAQSPRWVAERAFAKLLEDDLKLWNMPPAEDRHFLMQHLLERKGQILSIQPFLSFLQTLHPLDAERTRTVFLPFLGRMGILVMDSALEHVSLTTHGEALAHEYLLRDHRGTEAHWAPLCIHQPLVIQPTLELLTPMLQNPHRLLGLAQLSEVETMDAMVTCRIGADTLIRALDAGVSLDEIRDRLNDGSSFLPQPLKQLLGDLERRLGEVEVEQGVRLVRARTSQLAEELKLRPELASLSLRSISETVLEANGPGNAFALLKQAGFLPKPGRFLPVSVDGDESLYLWALACLAFIDDKGMNHHLDPVRQMIQGALQRVQNEDPNLYQEILRRVPMLHLGGGAQAADETQRILEYASRFNLITEITYMPLAAHRSQLRRVTPQAIEGEHLRAFCHLHQEEMTFRLSRIIGVRLLNEKGWTPVNSASHAG